MHCNNYRKLFLVLKKHLDTTDLKHDEVFIKHLHSTLHVVIIIDLQRQFKKKCDIYMEMH